MQNNGIHPYLNTGKAETGRAIALISKDSERTFATYLGAAVELSANDLHHEIFDRYDILHIEGYLLQNYELIKKAVLIARQKQMLVALDMASFNIVEQHKEFLSHLIKEFVDIVFANEDEARAFVDAAPEDALHQISEYCRIAVVKTGKSGSLIKQGADTHKIQAIEVNCIDTTGAGDLYASGFLYGLINDLPLDRCGAIGSIVAGNVTEFIGAKISPQRWDEIRSAIKKI